MAVRSTPDDYAPSPAAKREGQQEWDDIAPGKAATGDPQEGEYPPRDHAIAANAFGTTEREQLEGESIDQKLAREMPDFGDPRRPDHTDVQLVGESDAAEAYEDDGTA